MPNFKSNLLQSLLSTLKYSKVASISTIYITITPNFLLCPLFTMHSSHELLPSAIFLSFITLFLSCLTLTATATCHVDDETGLLAFKSGITSDPSHMLANWIKGTDCCQWNGITCLSGTRVTALYLSGSPGNRTSSLSGTISPQLSKLRFLDGIYFIDLKYLQGPFPNFLFSLPSLMVVYIENNNLSGPIPTNIGNLSHLYALSLVGNRFSGPIPSSIGQLNELSQLRLSGNRLTGNIPVTFQRLRTNLTVLSVDRNQLSGPIPDIFSGFSNLRTLNLSYNSFTGNIPASISALAPLLQYLEMGHNLLTGRIPDFLGAFRALDTLDLSHNQLSGTVPKTFANLTKIFNLDLSHNSLTDPFPRMFVRGIESLDLSYNKFHLGTIPQWVTNSTIIYSLKLAKCGLKFKLENWKPVQTYFYDYIDLSDNNITGSPVTLLNSTNYLVGFYAAGNRLKFNFERLKFSNTLKELDISRNLAFGKVPGSVTGIQKLNVSYNHLCGQLPATKFPASVFVGNDCLCGSPLPKCKKAT